MRVTTRVGLPKPILTQTYLCAQKSKTSKIATIDIKYLQQGSKGRDGKFGLLVSLSHHS